MLHPCTCKGHQSRVSLTFLCMIDSSPNTHEEGTHTLLFHVGQGLFSPALHGEGSEVMETFLNPWIPECSLAWVCPGAGSAPLGAPAHQSSPGEFLGLTQKMLRLSQFPQQLPQFPSSFPSFSNSPLPSSPSSSPSSPSSFPSFSSSPAAPPAAFPAFPVPHGAPVAESPGCVRKEQKQLWWLCSPDLLWEM